MTGLLQDRVVLVTGASRGIGKGLALGAAQAGAKLMLASRTLSDLERVAEEIRGLGGEAAVVAMDSHDLDSVEGAIDATVSRFGRIDVLMNNAGGSRTEEGVSTSILKASREEFTRMVELNFTSPAIAMRKAAQVMAKSGGGSIINITSTQAFYPPIGWPTYASSKAALQELTKLAAVEWGPLNVRVNAIGPGPIWSAALEKWDKTPEEIQALVKVPIGRIGFPADVASVAVFLASDQAAFVSGAAILVSGGTRYGFESAQNFAEMANKVE